MIYPIYLNEEHDDKNGWHLASYPVQVCKCTKGHQPDCLSSPLSHLTICLLPVGGGCRLLVDQWTRSDCSQCFALRSKQQARQSSNSEPV